MTTPNPNKIFQKNPGTIVKTVVDELVILPLGNQVKVSDLGSYYILKNKTAVFIWQLIDGKMTIADIRDAVTGRFDIEPEKAESDIVSFLGELHDIKAIA
jgi:hypothetical protein